MPPLALCASSAAERGLGRARLSSRHFRALKLVPNQWVRVIASRGEVRIARAWPYTTHSLSSSAICQCDTLILTKANQFELRDYATAFPSAEDGSFCLIKPINLKPQTLRKVRCRILPTSGKRSSNPEEQLKAIGCVLERVGVAERLKLVKSLLTNLVVRKGCVVGGDESGRCLSVKIIDTDPPTYEGLITPATLTFLTDEEDEELVDTDEIAEGSELADSKDAFTIMDIEDDKAKVRMPPGLEKAFSSLLETVMVPLIYGNLVSALGVECPKGVLLYGPPGVGKTLVVTAVAELCDAKLVMVNGTDVFGSYTGESEEKLKDRFKEALTKSSSGKDDKPCILFIDEIVREDAIAPNRTESSRSESRMVATLLTLMDGLVSRGRLVVVGATNRPNALDPALRRPGRQINPREDATSHLLEITVADFHHALSVTTPSTIRSAPWVAVGGDLRGSKEEEGSKPPGLRRYLGWGDVGGLDGVKRRLRQAVEWPILYAETFERLGLRPPRGILLYGPPGCSKTTLVKIIAATSGATFLAINGAEIFSSYVGDSERAVRLTFQRARASAPSVIFLDEVESIVGKRGMEAGKVGSGGEGDPVQERILSTLLNEMDGIEAAKDVLVVGATNRPDMIDAALMRPGRFDKVPPPDVEARRQILSIHTKGMPLAKDVNLAVLASFRTDRFTGADLESACREAALAALRESKGAGSVHMRHFESALKGMVPSISSEMLEQYAKFEEEYGKGV
ncbi:hypothetical protein HDU67_006709 [Dinochytrium kinnereticum]|nr:hypothetical protein HDU67_006709 [Dinochytrium kinnereticum]